MKQLLLFPDPRPLVERLGVQFFQEAPESPGVYLMRDQTGAVLYVGKAKNLRHRLANYRVANPDRMARRHLRLLRAVAEIELRLCADEADALATEAELLRSLRPRFNRAGTWKGPTRFLVWRVTEEGLDLAVAEAENAGWNNYGPLGAGVFPFRGVLARLLWCAAHPHRGLAGMPDGWFSGRFGPVARIPRAGARTACFEALERQLTAFFDGRGEEFAEWIVAQTPGQTTAFEVAVRTVDLEAVVEHVNRLRSLSLK